MGERWAAGLYSCPRLFDACLCVFEYKQNTVVHDYSLFDLLQLPNEFDDDDRLSPNAHCIPLHLSRKSTNQIDIQIFKTFPRRPSDVLKRFALTFHP